MGTKYTLPNVDENMFINYFIQLQTIVGLFIVLLYLLKPDQTGIREMHIAYVIRIVQQLCLWSTIMYSNDYSVDHALIVPTKL